MNSGQMGQRPGRTMSVQMTTFERRSFASTGVVPSLRQEGTIQLGSRSLVRLALRAGLGSRMSCRLKLRPLRRSGPTFHSVSNRAAKCRALNRSLSVVSLEIQPLVETGDLFLVAVKHEGFLPASQRAAFPNDAFAGLRPSRVIDVRVHVGVKAIFVGR